MLRRLALLLLWALSSAPEEGTALRREDHSVAMLPNAERPDNETSLEIPEAIGSDVPPDNLKNGEGEVALEEEGGASEGFSDEETEKDAGEFLEESEIPPEVLDSLARQQEKDGLGVLMEHDNSSIALVTEEQQGSCQ
uniref:RxLR effector protein n=1 Tax=Chromera velia CCMP2878 TaxID=1169474 RepID=A0A0G4F981_9ALVE|eukprot:Cvel_15850.t1-p1 / transcript=Cvel_15850.t1 / gene=Cvel_15850 / organism=Chromera_velia_CCMP2878 / gene_product=hypothetical protein / transcript_product=hypothetical protein / location=Cvel_scaffold1194:131-648(-) / protein_length=137 / sequence_SO=supercontig / SO=protein_coding / is_pseudo=false